MARHTLRLRRKRACPSCVQTESWVHEISGLCPSPARRQRVPEGGGEGLCERTPQPLLLPLSLSLISSPPCLDQRKVGSMPLRSDLALFAVA
jgi:hypothetical protein